MGEFPETGCLVVVQDEIRGARIGFVSGSKDNEIEITFEDSTNDSRWTPSLFSGDKEWFGERSPKICRESTHILIKVSRFHDDKVHCELFLGSRSSYRQRMRCLSFSKQSMAFSNICDCDAFQDNFKTLFGVPGLSFRGGVFGTKLIKKGSKFSIEAGDRFRPEHQSAMFMLSWEFQSPEFLGTQLSEFWWSKKENWTYARWIWRWSKRHGIHRTECSRRRARVCKRQLKAGMLQKLLLTPRARSTLLHLMRWRDPGLAKHRYFFSTSETFWWHLFFTRFSNRAPLALVQWQRPKTTTRQRRQSPHHVVAAELVDFPRFLKSLLLSPHQGPLVATSMFLKQFRLTSRLVKRSAILLLTWSAIRESQINRVKLFQAPKLLGEFHPISGLIWVQEPHTLRQLSSNHRHYFRTTKFECCASACKKLKSASKAFVNRTR